MSVNSSFTPALIKAAVDDHYINEDGSIIVDLFGANGTVFLGHGRKSVRTALIEQSEKVWNTGSVTSSPRRRAVAKLIEFIGTPYDCLGLYTTGMEAAEFAIRVARAHTNKPVIAGFEGAMHGKSMATAFLGWDNHNSITMPDVLRLPGIATNTQSVVLAATEKALKRGNISALFVEPFQATGGGYQAGGEFYTALNQLCRQHNALLIFDEILTGCYRTGQRFLFNALEVEPDIVLMGKALGNGFPISAVMAKKAIPCQPAMLPGSTFAGNPLGAAVAAAVLDEFAANPPTDQVANIEKTVMAILGDCDGVQLRGLGALWVIELRGSEMAQQTAECIYRRGVLVGQAGAYLRLLPPVCISQNHLFEACTTIRECVEGIMT